MKSKLNILVFLFLVNVCLPQLYGQTLLLENRIDSILNSMTTAEKIAQLNGNSFYTTPDLPRLNIPGFRMTDGAHGVSIGGSSFPSTIAMACTWNKKLVFDVGHAIATECWRLDRDQLLGPAIDITRDPRAGRTSESCGEDPYLNGQLSLASVRGIQSMPVIATTKHFMIEERQFIRNLINQIYTPRWIMEHYGYNYRICAQDGASLSFMSSYNLVNGQHASMNPFLLKTILRERWGFPFYVVSDWGGIYNGETEFSIKAGNDICMGTNHYASDLPYLVNNGNVPISVINDAVRNILRVKLLSGIIGYKPPKPDRSTSIWDHVTPEHIKLARKSVQESLVLLKNDLVLPVKKDDVNLIAVIGPNAKSKNLGFVGANYVVSPYAISILDGLEQKYGTNKIRYEKGSNVSGGDTSDFAAARLLAAQCDVVIFAGGLNETMEGEYLIISGSTTDRPTTNLPSIQQTLINELAKVNPNIVVVLQSGGICNINNCISNVKGLLYSFYGGMEAGNGVADVISGDYNPAGRLSNTMPLNDGQLPNWDSDFNNDFGSGYRWFDEQNITPAFPFGFGLSYTSFTYSNLQIPNPIQPKGSTITINVDVKNVGTMEGDEVVQLYISNKSANIWMPKKELKGFERIHLLPNETKTVTFTIKAEDMYYWDETKNEYNIFTGQYTFGIGGSSDNLPILGSFEWLPANDYPDLKITEIFTLPRFPRFGERVTFYAMIKNEGTGSTDSITKFNIPFFINNQLVATASQLSVKLNPGQAKLITCHDTSWTANYIGTSLLSANIDANNNIVELNENNNTYQENLKIYFDCDNLTNNNAAYLQPIRASSSENISFSASNLVDGNLVTRWASSYSEPQNIVITLDSITNISGIELYWEAAFAKKYTIQVSNDSANWTTVFAENNGIGGIETKLFSANAKYVKVNLSNRNLWLLGFSLYEIKIINANISDCPQIPVANAGRDTTVTLPATNFYLDGSQSYDPSGRPLTYNWTQISGPNYALMSDSNSIQCYLTNLIEGEYVFRLTINNGTYSVNDLVVINVLPKQNLISKINYNSLSNSDILIFPNPAKDILMIDSKLEGETVFTLLDLNGKILFQKSDILNGSVYKLPIKSNTPQGMYILSIKNKEGLFSKNIVII